MEAMLVVYSYLKRVKVLDRGWFLSNSDIVI